MRVLRILLTTGLVVALLAGTAFGAGYLYERYGDRDEQSAGGPNADDPAGDPGGDPASEADGDATGDPAVDQPETEQDDPSTPAKPVNRNLLSSGDKGEKVRELQHRLFQLEWLPELTTGTYDEDTKEAVSGFQAKRGFKATGAVDRRTWRRLVTMTKTPTYKQRHNILEPGPALLAAGASGEQVRDLQARLIQIAWLSGKVTGSYDPATVAAVKGFQQKRRIPVTGEVDQRTLDRLYAMTSTPSHAEKHNIAPPSGNSTSAALDPRCLSGSAMCIDKSTRTLRWVVGGKVVSTYEVRFGSDELPTREGAFSVTRKSRDHVSSIYHTPMPYAMFFSGGQAVHYSPDFAANGYAGASHGCVNVRDSAGIQWLFDQVSVGTPVIVYWS